MTHLTPREIVAELDKYIIGQTDAKKAVAIAVRNRWRRQQLPADIRRDVSPKNILMIGPTGVGKTEIARRLAGLTRAPFIKVEATKFTEVGYVGRDVESMVRDLLEISIRMIQQEQAEQMRSKAAEAAEDRLVDLLMPLDANADDTEATERHQRSRQKLRQQLAAGQLDDATVEVVIQEKPQTGNLLGMMGMDQMDAMGGGGLSEMFDRIMPGKTHRRRMKVPQAREFLIGQEADRYVDREQVISSAIENTENNGIIFIDEMDKIAAVESKNGPDVSRGGVQRDLLPIVEGSTVATKHGPVRTDHILFIAAGAFHNAEVSDLMPELQGRFPIRVTLNDLDKSDFRRILTEPHNSLIKQQTALLAMDGLAITFDDMAIDAIAQTAFDVNRKASNIGARRLHTVMELLFQDLAFEAPDLKDKKIRIDFNYVKQRLGEIQKAKDLTKYSL
ncbi:MAG TPA: ATP-dependent protease ATPase subunit HslU [Tepidisphaeraceae bacterium]|nr:ATP-dependent protease ATPase subunit HslU [Tepidisphaeraceae bacterium]